MKKFVLACTTSALALVSAPAFAQDAPADDAVNAEEAVNADEPITVTGSRTVTDGSRAPTPVTAVTSDALAQSSPSSIADGLNKLPIFANSSNQNTGGTFAATASQKGNFLNLRGLGTQRVLTLLNGTRAVPTASSLINGVDANMLPQMLVQRVDVVTGGVSAVYGSDAVSGVVNYVLDEKFSGVKVSAQTGVSTEGDDFSYKVGMAFGTSFGDRFHVIGSYERYQSDGIPSINARDWAHPGTSIVGGGSTANPFRIAPNATTNVMTYGGRVNTGIFADRRFQPDGTLVPFVHGTATATGVTEIGGDGIQYTTALAARLKTDQAFLRTTFDVTDAIQFYAQGSYARSQSGFDTQNQNHRPGSNRNITITQENPFLRPELAAQLAPGSSFSMGRFFRDLPSMSTESKTDYYSVQTGLKGEFGSNWKWDVNYVNGRSLLNFRANEFDARNFFAAIDAVDAGQFAGGARNGQIVCRITLTNPTFLPGCVPMNVLGEGNISQAAYDFVQSASTVRTVNKMQFVNVNLSGDLFELPAGPVTVAFGAEYRKQTLNQSSNADPFTLSTPALRAAYFGNIRNVPGNALKYLVVNQGVATGSQTVKEAYGEIQVPVLSDASFAGALDLNLAARITDYRTSGTVKTWKAGVNWVPTNGLRIRGTQSRDIAAPSLYDLFAGPNVRNLSPTDPLTGATNVIPIVNQGNNALNPEKSDTTALGIVVTPAAIPGLTFSADLYRIKINGAIQTASETTLLSECHASGGTSPACALIIRPFADYTSHGGANAPTQINVAPANLAFLLTKGIDFELGYTTSLGSNGSLSLRAFVNYLDTYNTQSSPTQLVLHRAGKTISGFDSAGLPKWRAMLSQTYAGENFSISLSERFTGSNIIGVTEVFAADVNRKMPNRTYFDLNLTADILSDKKAQFFLNVQNLFNTTPPVFQYGQAANLNTPTDTTKYDIVGRYFTTGVRLKF